jgi:hypothetical protein
LGQARLAFRYCDVVEMFAWAQHVADDVIGRSGFAQHRRQLAPQIVKVQVRDDRGRTGVVPRLIDAPVLHPFADLIAEDRRRGPGLGAVGIRSLSYTASDIASSDGGSIVSFVGVTGIDG